MFGLISWFCRMYVQVLRNPRHAGEGRLHTSPQLRRVTLPLLVHVLRHRFRISLVFFLPS